MVSQKPIVLIWPEGGGKRYQWQKVGGQGAPGRGLLKSTITIARRWSSRKNRVSENRPGFQLAVPDWLCYWSTELRVIPSITWPRPRLLV